MMEPDDSFAIVDLSHPALRQTNPNRDFAPQSPTVVPILPVVRSVTEL